MTPVLAFYLQAFSYLSSFRGGNGFGLNPIALQDIATYCEKIGYNDPDDFFFFAEVMRACDDVYLSQKNKEMKAEQERNRAGSKPSGAASFKGRRAGGSRPKGRR